MDVLREKSNENKDEAKHSSSIQDVESAAVRDIEIQDPLTSFVNV